MRRAFLSSPDGEVTGLRTGFEAPRTGLLRNERRGDHILYNRYALLELILYIQECAVRFVVSFASSVHIDIVHV